MSAKKAAEKAEPKKEKELEELEEENEEVEEEEELEEGPKAKTSSEKGAYSYKKTKEGYDVFDKDGKLHRAYSKEVSEKAVKGYVGKRNK